MDVRQPALGQAELVDEHRKRVLQVRLLVEHARRVVDDEQQVDVTVRRDRDARDFLRARRRVWYFRVDLRVDKGSVGTEDYFTDTPGRILLAAGRLEAPYPPSENPFRWTQSPDKAFMPGVPDRARQKNLNRRIEELPIARTMRIATSMATVTSPARKQNSTQYQKAERWARPEKFA